MEMERQIQETVLELLSCEEDINGVEITGLASFSIARVTSGAHGLVVRLADGSEYQLSIVRSR